MLADRSRILPSTRLLFPRHPFRHCGFIAHIQNNGFSVFQASHYIMHGTVVNKVLGTGTQAMYALTKAAIPLNNSQAAHKSALATTHNTQ